MYNWGGRLFIGAAFGLIAGAALHIVALIGGPKWIAFVGAPPSVVKSAADGTWLAPVGALAITGLLLALALYALSAAGLIRRLPLLRTVLSLCALAFLLRTLILAPAILSGRVNLLVFHHLFVIGSSIVIFAIGAALAAGLVMLRTQDNTT